MGYRLKSYNCRTNMWMGSSTSRTMMKLEKNGGSLSDWMMSMI